MSNYTQATFFGPKDNLPLNNPSKFILGTDVDTELAAIAAAITTKYDSSNITTAALAFQQGSITQAAGSGNNALTVTGSPIATYAMQIIGSSTQNANVLGLNVEIELNHPGAASWDDFAQASECFIPIGNTQNFTGQVTGVYGSISHFGSGTLGQGIGGGFEAFNPGPATGVVVIGLQATANNGGVATGFPVQQTPTNNGTAATARAIDVVVKNYSSGAITGAQGIYINSAQLLGSGGITNNYALQIADQTVGTNNYAILTGKGLVNFGDAVTIQPSTASTALTIVGTNSARAMAIAAGQNQFGLDIFGSSAAGQSLGLYIQAGTNSSDAAFEVVNAAGSIVYAKVRGDGAIQGYGPTAAALVDMTPDTGTFTATYTGMTATVSGTASWVRVGKLVTIYLPNVTGTSNVNTMTITGIPAAIQPPTLTQSISNTVPYDSGGTRTETSLDITITANSGTWTLGVDGSSTGFSATGTKGLLGGLVSYLLL